MKTLHIALFFAVSIFLFESSHAEVVVNFSTNTYAPNLECPTPPKSIKRKLIPSEDPYEIPDDSDIFDLLKIQNNTDDAPIDKLTLKSNNNITSIGIWGDSHVAAYFFTDELIKGLRLRPENVYQKFIPPTMGRPGVRLPLRKYCQGGTWKYSPAYISPTSTSQIGLIEIDSSTPQSYLWIDFRKEKEKSNLQELKIPFSVKGSQTKISISINGESEEYLSLAPSRNDFITIKANNPFSTLKIRLLDGDIKIGGFIPTYTDQPLLYLDTMGIPGSTMRGWSENNNSDLQNQKNTIFYDITILEYGTNEGNDPNFNEQKYRNNLQQYLGNFKKIYPDSACILIGPTDRGILEKRSRKKLKKISSQELLKYSMRHQIIADIQDEEAQKNGCFFWNWQNAMGGTGSAYRWLKQNPPLISKDLTHLTILGYQISAQKFSRHLNLSDSLKNKQQ